MDIGKLILFLDTLPQSEGTRLGSQGGGIITWKVRNLTVSVSYNNTVVNLQQNVVITDIVITNQGKKYRVNPSLQCNLLHATVRAIEYGYASREELDELIKSL